MAHLGFRLRIGLDDHPLREMAVFQVVDALSTTFLDPKRVTFFSIPGVNIRRMGRSVYVAGEPPTYFLTGRGMADGERILPGADALTILENGRWMEWHKDKMELICVLREARDRLNKSTIDEQRMADNQIRWIYSGLVHLFAPSDSELSEERWFYRQGHGIPPEFAEICRVSASYWYPEGSFLSFDFQSDVMGHYAIAVDDKLKLTPRAVTRAVDANTRRFVSALRAAVIASVQSGTFYWEFDADRYPELTGILEAEMARLFGTANEKHEIEQLGRASS